MQRWEPSRIPDPKTEQRARKKDRRRAEQRQAMPEGIRIAAIRALVGLSFIVPATAATSRTWMLIAGGGALLALIVLSAFPTSWGTSGSRLSWAADALSLGLLTPILAFNLFAGTGDGELLPAEQSVYVQTVFMATVLLLGLAVLDVTAGTSVLRRWGITLLPAALTVPALAGVHAEVRGITVAGALAMTWLIAALATAITHLVPGRLAAPVPLIVFLLFCVVNIAARPGVLTLGDQHDLVSMIHPLLVFVAGASLLVGPLLDVLNKTQQQRRRPSDARRRSI